MPILLKNRGIGFLQHNFDKFITIPLYFLEKNKDG